MPRRTKSFVLIQSQFAGCDVPVVVAGFAEGQSRPFHFQYLILGGSQLFSGSSQVTVGNDPGAVVQFYVALCVVDTSVVAA